MPASVAQPLLLPDLPVFLRWRGLPPFGDGPFEELVGIVDRLIVDGTDVVRGGALVRASEQEIAREHRKQAARLWA